MTDDFETFWTNYPTDRNMPKKLARKQWLLMKPEQHQRALSAIPGFKSYCAANAWYRPIYAHRFLKEERYEGFQTEAIDPEKLAHAKDWADRYFKRGKYAETYQ